MGPPPEGWRYLIALGSNVRHRRHGAPEAVLAAALARLAEIGAEIGGEAGLVVERAAPVLRSAPLGPSARRYANGAVLMRTDLVPDRLLALLKRVEAHFGRRRGRRWGARVLDLDIVLWTGGVWRSGGMGGVWLKVPHPCFRARGFVLRPALALTPCWRDPESNLTVRQLHARLTRPSPAPRAPSRAARTSVRSGP